MIVGEAPGERELAARTPFVGPSGFELDKLLAEAGMARSLAFVTNVCRVRPEKNDIGSFLDERKRCPDPAWAKFHDRWAHPFIHQGAQLLEEELARVQPVVVIALGNLALAALTGKWGVSKWRGSVLQVERPWGKFKVIPTYHPAAVLRQWELRPTVAHDMKRVAVELQRGREVVRPNYRFIIRPNFETASQTLSNLLTLLETAARPVKLAVDKETRAGHISCLGIAWSAEDAICLPFMCVERPEGYWPLEEETEIVWLLSKILRHPKAEIVGQNFLYDMQYAFKHWHFIPGLARDTMISQHSMFSTGQKGLDYLASLYCDSYEYWKDDGKLWDPSIPEDEHWEYNAKDCVLTYQVDDGQAKAIQAMTPSWPQLPEVVAFQQRLTSAVLRTMIRGVRFDEAKRTEFKISLMQTMQEHQNWINEVTGQDLNLRSALQMQDFFYQQLAMKPVLKRTAQGVYRPTTDDDALAKLAAREPILRPLIERMRLMRSLGVFVGTFLSVKVGPDGRLRCQYKIAGTDTYRFASSEDAFGFGTNLQNVPAGDENEGLPNIRDLMLADEGMTFFDIDLDSADLRVVTWESGCVGMKEYFKAGLKPYVEIAKEFFRDPTITKNHASYKRMKALCHGTNYLGTPEGLSARIGLPVAEVERIQKWYYGKFPEIKAWQDDIRKQVDTRRYIENVFGYRYYIFGRVEGNTYNQAVAWKPQSTVGCLINRAYVNIHENLPWAEVLLQVHDSLAGQYPTVLGDSAMAQIIEQAQVPLPYDEPLVIPVGIKTSTKSWGDCK